VLERGSGLEAGDLVRCVVIGTEGADLQVSPREVLPRRAAALVGAGAS
jgi:ribosomal protein S12 methylthiotransferase